MKKTKSRKQRKRSQWADVWKRLTRNRLAMVSLVCLILILLSAVFAGVLSPYDYAEQDFENRFALPSLEHPFGTDNYGRDILSRVLHGGRISLLVSFMAVFISVILGTLFGVIAGYYGGLTDGIVMRIMDVVMAIPSFLLAVSISAALGSGIGNSALALAISGIPGISRMVRATVLSIREQEYIEAARATGSKNIRIILNHVIPNAFAPLLVEASLCLGMNILSIAGLSFIGLGVQPPTPEWGSILSAGREFLRDFWPIVTFPGVAIVVTMISFNLFGDGLRDALDPKLKR